MLKSEIIAAIAHAINKAYCESLGDNSQLPFEESPEALQQGIIAGVEMHLANPDITPEQSHEAWLKHKEADGWVYGEEKDVAKKIHPCMVAYEELPQEQQSKDYLFKAVILAVKDLVHPSDIEQPSNELEELRAEVARLTAMKAADPNISGIAIRYFGMHKSWEDHLYGSGLVFQQGEVKLVPERLAKKFLHHADMFEVAEVNADTPLEVAALDEADEAEALKEEQAVEENAVFETLQLIDDMRTKASLVEYAEKNYSVKLNDKLKMDDLKAEVKELVNKFGVL